MLALPGCSSQSGNSTETKSSTAQTWQPDQDIGKLVVEVPGKFRFVNCRLSNIESLAMTRCISMFEQDGYDLFRHKTANCLKDFCSIYNIHKFDIDSFLDKHDTVFERLIAESEVESQFTKPFNTSFVAYMVATIDLVDLEQSMQVLLDDFRQIHNLKEVDKEILLDNLRFSFSVDWTGQWLPEVWQDPLRTQPEN